jgi:hypothetical protein
MNYSKIIAGIFIFISFGAVLETWRICTTDAPDVALNRGFLVPLHGILTAVIIGLAVFFWRRGNRKLK